MNRIFFYPDNAGYVLFTERALQHMYAYAQRRFWQKEAGGEIFSSEPDSCGLIVSAATGPNPSDYRSRYSWNPDIHASYENRQFEYTQNKHAVGLWHTHPERSPSPSGLDRKTTSEYLDSFRGERSCYLMAIIGNHGSIPAMVVWAANYGAFDEWIQLKEAR
ncbi:Mov34/MPN/PAD-1 family protein [Nitrincola sp. MINF-07-Sa-05]|uniref:Mov34/MPN/PAD-1 family protein n=1 Tax=Nitrincola salilacus TaxID=3400273 RepID=UPI003917B85A